MSSLPSASPAVPAQDEHAAPVDELSASDVADAARAVEAFGLSLLGYSRVIPRLPAAHRDAAVRSMEETLFHGKPEASARLSLLVCMDAVVAERTVGTGMRDLFARHFPDLGSQRDLDVLADRQSTPYREFAKDRVRWLYAGPYAELQPHQSMSFMGVLGELMHAGEPPAPATEPRAPAAPWAPEPKQAAFAAVAAFHVSRPTYATAALSCLDDRVVRALSLWAPRAPDRWVVAAELMDAIGLGTKSESLRGQWNDFEKVRGRANQVVEIALEPL